MPFGGALIAGGSSLLSGIFGSKGAKDAAKAQAAAQQKVIDFTTQQIASGKAGISDALGGVKDATAAGQGDVAAGVTGANQTLSDSQQKQLALLLPFLQSGTSSLSSLQDLAGENGPFGQKFSFNTEDLPKDPGYQFTLQQGQDAIQRAAAAQGGLFSSGTLKSLAGYTAGTANQYFNDAYTRALNTFKTNQQSALNRVGTLQGLAGLGYGATGLGTGAIGSTSSEAARNTLTGSEFGANLGEQGAGLALSGQEASGQLGLEGARAVGGAQTAQGNANAAGIAGSTNAWLNALQNGNNSIVSYLAGRKLGSLNPSGVQGPPPGWIPPSTIPAP